MDKAALLKQITTALAKKRALSLAYDYRNSVGEVIELSMYKDHEIAFRAGWILEFIAFSYPDQFREHLPEFIDVYLIQKNQSCQRLYTKILMDLTKAKKERSFSESRLDAIVETTFEWMIDPQTPVAVRVNCMDILYNLRNDYEWIGEELSAQVEFFLKNGSAALQSRGKKILHKLSAARKRV